MSIRLDNKIDLSDKYITIVDYVKINGKDGVLVDTSLLDDDILNEIIYKVKDKDIIIVINGYIRGVSGLELLIIFMYVNKKNQIIYLNEVSNSKRFMFSENPITLTINDLGENPIEIHYNRYVLQVNDRKYIVVPSEYRVLYMKK